MALAYCDMGAGHEPARMRAVDVACTAVQPPPIWTFDTAWVRRTRPALSRSVGLHQVTASPGICGCPTWSLAGTWRCGSRPTCATTRHAIELDVEVAGTRPAPRAAGQRGGRPSTGPGPAGACATRATFTSLSPLLVLAPADQVEIRSAGGPPAGEACERDGGGPGRRRGRPRTRSWPTRAAWLSYFAARYGRWAHGDEFLAVVWDGRGGWSTTGPLPRAAPALEHEVFHSWFGRGVKPPAALTAGSTRPWLPGPRRPGATAGPVQAEELGLDEEPVLLCPAHPWSRHTPRRPTQPGAPAGSAWPTWPAARRPAARPWPAGTGLMPGRLGYHRKTWPATWRAGVGRTSGHGGTAMSTARRAHSGTKRLSPAREALARAAAVARAALCSRARVAILAEPSN